MHHRMFSRIPASGTLLSYDIIFPDIAKCPLECKIILGLDERVSFF